MSKKTTTTTKGPSILKSAKELLTLANSGREITFYANPRTKSVITKPANWGENPKNNRAWLSEKERQGFYEMTISLGEYEPRPETLSLHVQAYKPSEGDELMNEDGDYVKFAASMGFWASKAHNHKLFLMKDDAPYSEKNDYTTPPDEVMNGKMREFLAQYAD